MKIKTYQNKMILCFVVFCLVLFSLPAMGQDDEDPGSSGPIMRVDLGVSSLHLQVGESYTFQVKFEPENTVLTTLDWYVSDESVISVDPLTDTVTALADGEARIFAESFDQFSYAVCTVTVGDSVSKDAAVMKSGGDYMGLSQKDLKKISAETITRYLDFIDDSAMTEKSYDNAADRMFDVIAAVKPGTEEAQSKRAIGCGMEYSDPLKELNAITLTGSLDAILKYVKNNPDLKQVFELGPFAIEDPVHEEVSSESIQKTVGLRGNTQQLTNINFAQNTLGLTGKGRWIAVIDSGINYNNPQFKGNRQIIEKCFSRAVKFNDGSYIRSVCKDGAEGKGTSAPRDAWNKKEFDHGSHVTGIAAGKDGIAPLANIISVQSHSEKVWTCKNSDEKKQFSCGSNRGNQCCASFISNGNLSRAYDYLVSLSKTKKIKIDAVNMSYGNQTKYVNNCDVASKWDKGFFDKMIAEGMLPIVASGNQGFDGGLHSAACLSNAYVVGGLANQKNPLLRVRSSHSRKLDITAPGSDIYSAGYTKTMMNMSGTSMATPMVTGAIALVKQMYPGMTSDDAGKFLKLISEKTVNRRLGKNWKFNYNKPVLTFGNIYKLNIPSYSWITGGNNSVTFKVYRMARQAAFSAEVTTLSGQKISKTRVLTKSDGNFTYVTVTSPNMKNGYIYKIKLTRTFKAGSKSYRSWVTEYGRPVDIKSAIKNVSAENGGVTLTSVSGTVRYNIYDQTTGQLVKFVSVKDGSKPFKITGLINGRLYSATAAPYKTIAINKGGKKINVPFHSSESGRYQFMPLSAPFNAYVSYPAVANPTSATVSCTADSGATGIRVSYRKSDSTGSWTPGCVTKDGKFSCEVQNTGRGYDFSVQKYKILNNKTYAGPIVLVKGR